MPCNGNGQCDLKSGLCSCDEEHQGYDCSGKLITYYVGDKTKVI